MKGGEVEALTSNYIAAVFVSRCCATAFWCWGYDEMAPKDGSLNFAGYWCLFAHGVSVLVSADFMSAGFRRLRAWAFISIYSVRQGTLRACWRS